MDDTTKYYVRDLTGKEEKEFELGAFLDESDSWLMYKNWKVVSNLTSCEIYPSFLPFSCLWPTFGKIQRFLPI